MPPSTLAAVWRFHLRVGAGLAARVLVPTLISAVAVAMVLGPDFINSLSLALFGPRAGAAAALLVLGMALAAAGVAARLVTTGLGGWLRHLPVAGTTHRRAAAAAVLVAELPLLLILAAAASPALPARAAAGAAAAAPLAGLPIVGLAGAFAALRVRRRAAVVPLALAAGVLAGLGSWWTLAVALPLLAAADLAAGPLVDAGERAPARSARSLLPARIAGRAFGWRLAQAYALALLPWLAGALFVANNRLAAPYPTRAALLGGAGAAVFLLAILAGTLARRRPAWPWARSLPWSAQRRVLGDAALLGTLCLPLVLLTAAIAPAAILPLAGFLPLLALRAAAAVRRAPGSRRGPVGELLSEGLFLAGLVALVPWAALALLAALPWAASAAAARERGQKVGAWTPRHYLAAGDSQSWSGG